MSSAIRHDVVLAVPTLNRYDGLLDLLESVEAGTVRPGRYLIIDNGGALASSLDWLGRELPDRTTIEVPSRNLGVAASWNVALRVDAPITIIGADDCTVERDTIENMLDAAGDGSEAKFVSPVNMRDIRHSPWSFFLHTRAFTRAVGLYDERFWPGYFEDNDYDRRMRLLGHEVVRSGRFHHLGGGTSQQFSQKTLWDENRAKYEKKWGGSPGHETVTDIPATFFRETSS